ncbi:ABC transporter permease [Rathayibacter iranicus]|uniref:ABC transporter permease n=2 Tax=Rathayibacter iranicus TaxID=59737 RepID=A0AAD2PTU6_9MICO|nr:ABC transporter permease subunit [Rathayibacter iranicus]AZZ54818.1 ABC transporter permease [Rathayibacter iranicus]MWV31383.1 ABC transporter permease subunit [Rathayibacter iranicus NCPPB 2253 = VKM Ac-1602]PPI50411.1 ABC transporter permease [Rathayibacter iranicus]PPI62737.1 ABC transporter permease [Rathayibacter iranicus]PPI73810.1 ABC transporter permease [Rathayibacter iranicus]
MSRVDATERRGTGVGSLLVSELALLFRRRRTWALLAALAAIPVLLAVAVRLSGEGDGPSFVGAIAGNGLFTGLAAITVAVPLFLPLTVGVVAGDAIAGEASLGTLRYLLVTPVGRVRLLAVKFLASLAFCLAAALTVMVAGILIGLALFPAGPVTLLSGTTVPLVDAIGRALAIAVYAALSLVGLAAIGLFISTLTDVPVGAMAATVVVSIAAQIVGSLSQLAVLHPFLLTSRWFNFADLLRDPIAWGSFGENAVLQLAYVAVFGSLAIARFTTRDILS